MTNSKVYIHEGACGELAPLRTGRQPHVEDRKPLDQL
jgi:hypothetical protein